MLTALIIFCAKYLVILPPVVLLVALYYKKHKQSFIVFSLTSLALAYATAKFVSLFWYDPLPFVVGNFTPLIAHAADNGFPSDHVLFAATLASIGFYYNRTLGLALWLVALIVGLARILAGVHHGVDIVASAVIAVLAVLAARAILKQVY